MPGHPRHTCANCRLTIEPDEAEVRIDTAKLKARLRAAGMPTGNYDQPVRYRHASYETCSRREAEAARWHREDAPA